MALNISPSAAVPPDYFGRVLEQLAARGCLDCERVAALQASIIESVQAKLDWSARSMEVTYDADAQTLTVDVLSVMGKLYRQSFFLGAKPLREPLP